MTNRTTSFGLWRHAEDFLIAAHSVLNSRGQFVNLPSYYLLGHSIELSLKAFLLARGVSISQLRNPRTFGHDLSALLRESRRRRLGLEVKLSHQELGVVELLNVDYKAKRFEYRQSGVYMLPLIDATEDVAKKLVFGLKKYCESASLAKSVVQTSGH